VIILDLKEFPGIQGIVRVLEKRGNRLFVSMATEKEIAEGEMMSVCEAMKGCNSLALTIKFKSDG